ncbi:MAG: transposase [Catenulispora sp.]|nr:transposase [Catenulispora sp.]NUR61003.1 transposase [Catenulispora sp.]
MNTNPEPAEGTDSVVYQVKLPLSSRVLAVVAELIRTRRKVLGTRWRKADAGRQALIVLAHLRHDQRLADLAGGNGVSASTVRRWVLEVIKLLAAKAPRLERALGKIARSGGEAVLIDGTLVRTRRRTGKANRKNYSGKHKAHGLLFLAVTDDRGNLLWISAAKPGRASDITAARHNHITTKLREAGLGAIGDLGFVGLDDDPDDPDDPVIITGKKAARKRPLTDAQKEANKLISRERAANEHAFADLKAWRILAKVRMNARHATDLLRALLVLTRLQVTR